MIKKSALAALLLAAGLSNAFAHADVTLGELVTATHDDGWQPVELQEEIQVMKPVLRAFTPKAEASFEVLTKTVPESGFEHYENMLDAAGDPIGDGAARMEFAKKIGKDFEVLSYKTARCPYGPLPCLMTDTTYRMQHQGMKTDVTSREFTVFNKKTGNVYVVRVAGVTDKIDPLLKGTDVLVQFLMKRDQ